MDKIYVIFWTMGGNTQAMAEAVADGIRKAGKEAEVAFVGTVSADTLKDASAFALGCPAMGAEVLEESVMEPFVMEVEGFAAGKKIALFGSYGWGSGQWLEDWCARCKEDGAVMQEEPGVMANEAPDDDAIAACNALGAKLAGS